MYKDSFKDLVNFAFKLSESDSELVEGEASPYYLGFGNPNSNILIVGQEKAIHEGDQTQIRSESYENVKQWKYLIDNDINDIFYDFYPNKEPINRFENPLYPYKGKVRRGNTWNHYQKLVDFILENSQKNQLDIYNGFLKKSFITEVNFPTSKTQLGRVETSKKSAILRHTFYKDFDKIILACGDYLSYQEIEDIYQVYFEKDESQPRERLKIFRNDKKSQIVINTRQLSQDVRIDYLKKIVHIANSKV